jgi:hypothetical protein
MFLRKKYGERLNREYWSRDQKKHAVQLQYMDLNLFPDLFKDSGSVINDGVLRGLSPYLLYCYYVLSAYLKNNERTV